MLVVDGWVNIKSINFHIDQTSIAIHCRPVIEFLTIYDIMLFFAGHYETDFDPYMTSHRREFPWQPQSNNDGNR